MYKFVLAIRYLLKRKISWFSLVAVSLCVFIVLVVMTVLSGLTSEFRNYTHLATGDCVVSTKSLVGFPYYEEFLEILRNNKIVEAASPVIRNYAVVADIGEYQKVLIGYQETLGIVGIEPSTYGKVTNFSQCLHYHRKDVADAFKSSWSPQSAGCVPGIALLFERDQNGNYITPSEIPQGKLEVSCIPLTAKGSLAKGGLTEFSTKVFYLSDCSETGFIADWTLIYLPFDDVQTLCGMSGADKRTSAIHIKFKPQIDLNIGCEEIEKLWDGFIAQKSSSEYIDLLKKVEVKSWSNHSRLMIAAMESEKVAMIFTFAMIGVLTIFIVFVVLYMIIAHKSKDIGILKSVGATDSNVMVLFLNFALLVGALGSIIGSLSGWYFLAHINQIEDWLFRHFGFQLWDRTMYAIRAIPNNIDLKVLAFIIVAAIAACLVGAFIPAWQAAKLNPVKTLQVNRL